MIALTSPGEELNRLKEEEGFQIIELPMARHISIWKDLKALFLLIKVFRKEKPMVVHSITPKAGLLCMVSSWITRVPYRIHTFTGLVWPTATGITKRILMVTDWITCACATHVIPEGEGVKDDLQHFITNKPMRVLGYGNLRGVDMERFNPARFEKNCSDSFIFLFVGRVVGDKGINELVWAFVRLQERHPETRLWLVGDYESNLDALKPKTQEMMDSNNAIEAKGALYGDDLIRAYSEADCFVMPSYREGFPNSVLEAGAMGLPQIVTDINGSREIIRNEINGLIVPPKDKMALYNAMERMITDQCLRNDLKSHAREMISSRYERGFVQKCQIDYYEEILNHKGK